MTEKESVAFPQGIGLNNGHILQTPFMNSQNLILQREQFQLSVILYLVQQVL